MIQRALLGEKHDAAEVLRFVMPASDPYGLTRVDETEIFSLQHFAAGDTSDSDVTRMTFSLDDQLVGYATWGGQVADCAASAAHRNACLMLLAEIATPGTDVWVRGVAPGDVHTLTDVGSVRRKLAVMVCTLTDIDGLDCDRQNIRAFQPGVDDEAVVAVLARAYAGTPEDNWTHDSFARRVSYPWFRAEDLLVFVNPDDSIAGVHWMKQRDRRTGEVYNLAVDPAFAGAGLGSRLLHAGMRQLKNRGLSQMVLWVDQANVPAVQVYRRAGFTTHTVDVALRLAVA